MPEEKQTDDIEKVLSDLKSISFRCGDLVWRTKYCKTRGSEGAEQNA